MRTRFCYASGKEEAYMIDDSGNVINGKRKTHTSTEVKRRYNEKVYDRIGVAVPKALAAEFKEECERRGVSQASVIKEAIQNFLDAKTDAKKPGDVENT